LDTIDVRKTYSQEVWNNIYENRFDNFRKKREFSLELKKINKKVKEKDEEEKILKHLNDKHKKTNKSEIKKHVDRLYDDAIKRQRRRTLNDMKESPLISPPKSICMFSPVFKIKIEN
jgi:hypothetical protein